MTLLRLLAVLAAALSVSASAPEEPALRPLRIAMGRLPAHVHVALAIEQRLFEAEGVAVEAVRTETPGQARSAYEQGRADAWLCTPLELLHVREGGRRDPRVVLVVATSRGAHAVIAREDVRGLQQLEGAYVGVEPESAGLQLLGRALEVAFLDPGRVRLVPMPAAEMAGALRSGRVQAVVAGPPVAVPLAASSGTRVLFSSREVPDELVTLLVVDGSALERRAYLPDVLWRSWSAAREVASSDPGAALESFGRFTGLDEERLRAELAAHHFPEPKDQLRVLSPDGPIVDLLLSVHRRLEATGHLKRDLDRQAIVAFRPGREGSPALTDAPEAPLPPASPSRRLD